MSNNTLLISLQSVEKEIKNNPIQLLIIDTINNYYRSEKGDPAVSFSRVRTRFLKILQKIFELTKTFNLITILTAQITPNFIDDAVIKEYPVGIHYLNHFFSEMFYLSHKNDDEQNLCYIHRVNSSFLPEKKLLFEITPKGLVDYKI
jgi:predicted ATP-dependent serine protease